MALMDYGWEARMAERAKQRRVRAEIEQEIRAAASVNEMRAAFAVIDPAVYHGWPLRDNGTAVYVGNGIFCAGCGFPMGNFSIAITDDYLDWERGRPDPDWPFTRETCPARGALAYIGH